MMEWNNSDGGNGTSSGHIKNIYARGADDGFWLGVYFSALFGLTVTAMSVPLVNIIVGAMVLGVPFLTYFFLRRTHVAAHGMTVFSALWMQGIVMFACGCIILGLVIFVYLRWIDPAFMSRVLQAGLDYYSRLPGEGAKEMYDQLRMIADSNAIPTPLNMAMGWMWLGMFSGSLLSMLVAAVVRLRKVRN